MRESWHEVANVCQALTIVEVATVPGSCIPCEANPLDLLCHCHAGRKTGICSHILFTTHIIFRDAEQVEQRPRYNLYYMMGKINGARKRGHRPKRVKDCLTREDSDGEAEEAEEAPALEW